MQRIRQLGQSTSGTKIIPCLTRVSIAKSIINLLLNLSSLSPSSVALSFWAATRIYLTEGNRWIRDNSILHEFIRTCPFFEPLLNETNYFSHYSGKFIYCLAQFIWVGDFLESVELAGQSSDTLCKAFHWFMRFFLGLEMLPTSSVVWFASRIERESTWYAASMQETTVSAIGFSCFESDNEHVCFATDDLPRWQSFQLQYLLPHHRSRNQDHPKWVWTCPSSRSRSWTVYPMRSR